MAWGQVCVQSRMGLKVWVSHVNFTTPCHMDVKKYEITRSLQPNCHHPIIMLNQISLVDGHMNVGSLTVCKG